MSDAEAAAVANTMNFDDHAKQKAIIYFLGWGLLICILGLVAIAVLSVFFNAVNPQAVNAVREFLGQPILVILGAFAGYVTGKNTATVVQKPPT